MRFERLVAERRWREALELWRGPALADFTGLTFAQAEIARLEEQRLAATEARIDDDLRAGRHRELIGPLQQRVAEQPLRERAYEQLMLALARSGRRADALAVYRQARAVLVEGLGLEPGAKLRELERRVLAQEEDAGEARAPLPPTPTIGREADLERLRGVLAGQRLITVVGPGGVGKTRLATVVANALAARFSGGADFVSLAAVGAAEDVVSAIVRQLAVAPVGSETLEQALTRHRAPRAAARAGQLRARPRRGAAGREPAQRLPEPDRPGDQPRAAAAPSRAQGGGAARGPAVARARRPRARNDHPR